MKIVFIRHGKTAGNLEKRYIGRTDESLCTEGKTEILDREYPIVNTVICSPMKRCIQTAQLIYPDKKVVVVDGLRECDFGSFEKMNYEDLSGNADYQRWIDSNGKMQFPQGEAPDEFKKRCVLAFKQAVDEYNNCDSLGFIVHGGTIMAILEKYAVPHCSFYDFLVKNGCGYVVDFDGDKLTILQEIK